MDIHLNNIGKKYNKHFIIKGFSASFSPKHIIGIKGSNGSGKSTLLKLISSVLTPSEGTITYTTNNQEIDIANARQQFALVAPAVDLLGTLTVEQTINFHFSFREYFQIHSTEELLEKLWLEDQKRTLVNELSSGMRQRLKLGLAFFSNVKFILLDEPTSNLDLKGIEWVNSLIQNQLGNRGLIIASNEDRDFTHCETIFDVMDFKEN